MAGAGYKLFNTGDILTAQQVNEYLMQQTVMVFANAAARTTALSGILAEGLVSYLKDTDVVEIYTGAAWVSLDDPNAIQNSIVDAKGDLISATADNTPARLASSAVNGDVLTVDTTTATGLKWAAPVSGAITWTLRKSGDGTALYKIAYNGSNLYVAVGASGSLFSSPDGKTWTSRTSGFGANQINDVSFGNGLWVAVGNNGTITTSTDGTTWTSRTANMSTNAIRNVIYANSLWVAIGAGGGTTNTGGITYSTDGITWTRKSQSITVGGDYWSIIWNGTNWVIGADLSTNNYLYASAPSGTWTAGSTGVGVGLYQLFWDGTRHTVVYQDYAYGYSTSTTLGTTTAYSGNLPSASAPVLPQHTRMMYNNIIYNLGIYIQSFTPSSTLYPDYGAAIIAPSGTQNSSSTLNTNNSRLYFIGAVGQIVGDSQGRLWTSF